MRDSCEIPRHLGRVRCRAAVRERDGDDPVATVISANVKRRKMLTMGQRAIAAPNHGRLSVAG